MDFFFSVYKECCWFWIHWASFVFQTVDDRTTAKLLSQSLFNIPSNEPWTFTVHHSRVIWAVIFFLVALFSFSCFKWTHEGLTVLCETKWGETKWNETKLGICILRNEMGNLCFAKQNGTKRNKIGNLNFAKWTISVLCEMDLSRKIVPKVATTENHNLWSEFHWNDKVLSVDIPQGKDDKISSIFIQTKTFCKNIVFLNLVTGYTQHAIDLSFLYLVFGIPMCG